MTLLLAVIQFAVVVGAVYGFITLTHKWFW